MKQQMLTILKIKKRYEMKQTTHRNVAILACNLLSTKDSNLHLLNDWFQLGKGADEIDNKNDMEFVDVDGDPDDPHEDSFWHIDDVTHYSKSGRKFTSYNHFIDIKKGAGVFDDYDGYSYQNGSAKIGQYQTARDATDDPWISAILGLSPVKVDSGLAWWFNDEYIHVKGHPWYEDCSPATEQYSFYTDKGIYSSKENELTNRFPIITEDGDGDEGYPYSVFMPVDNLARYWHSRYAIAGDPYHLGHALHALHDATVPHHASGYCGNWHARYESDLDHAFDNSWVSSTGFQNEVITLFDQWYEEKTHPNHLYRHNWDLTPGKNWRIDYMVTWLALHGYKEYNEIYNNFSNGYSFNEASARQLMIKAIAMTMVVIAKSSGYVKTIPVQETKPKISPEKWLYNFGIVWPGEVKTVTIKITSSGDEPLEISEIIPPKSKRCTIVSTTPVNYSRLAPGETLTLRVRHINPKYRFNVKGGGVRSVYASPLTKVFQDELVIKSNAENNPNLVIQLKMGGRLPFQTPKEIDNQIHLIDRQMRHPRIPKKYKTKLKQRITELKRLKKIMT